MSLEQEVTVSVDSFYLGAQSDPAEHRYVFAYCVNITNQSEQQVQLLSRYWQITDGNGKQTEVSGEGVIGVQPQLAPGETYSYTSGAVLETPVGTMQGYYEMIDQKQQSFRTPIPLFRLAQPHILN
ncbi:Co2+/Mg2+ efflux protein ApaG [Rheinheimera sp. UJ51]|uniref:Co2+/Mg2+ efflux protein ApaG n=1 Tax=Rheinheimera sp. UJ51 TaxID=2892446 RepID=UPI001E4FDAEB|nr:Co2+/Mg2+ efflux protein ApaG [Rheinheimera sp. UJ51]MCC5453067.1 Co2+/Mg2+ efflux protein ApaG [Rheinheimera sp. UJ51]